METINPTQFREHGRVSGHTIRKMLEAFHVVSEGRNVVFIAGDKSDQAEWAFRKIADAAVAVFGTHFLKIEARDCCITFGEKVWLRVFPYPPGEKRYEPTDHWTRLRGLRGFDLVLD